MYFTMLSPLKFMNMFIKTFFFSNIEDDKMLFGCFNMLLESTSTYEPQTIVFTSLKSLKHLGGYDLLVKATLQGVDNLC